MNPPSRPARAALVGLALGGAPLPAAAQAPARDSVIYAVAPASRLDVRTGKAGLLGFAGHEHTIRARGFEGRVVYFPAEPAASRVAIRVAADSLEVLTPPDTAEIRSVTEAMRGAVLQSDRYPEIRFASRALVAIPGGFRMSATLTLHGRSREVPVDVRVVFSGDTLRASASFAVNQSDFGIRPFRGGPGGTVRVADRVTFDVDVIAVRRPGA